MKFETEEFEGRPYYFYGEKTFTTPNGKETLRKVAITGIEEGGVITIGIATCSDSDKYIKKKGRMIATNRAIKGMNNPEIINEKDTMDILVTSTDKPGHEFEEYCNSYCSSELDEFDSI